MSALSLLLLLPPAAFAAVALLARVRRAAAMDRVGTVASATGIVVALAAAGWVAVDGPHTSPGVTVDGIGFSVRADALSVTMLAMVTVLAAVIVRYSGRYLHGETRRTVFLGRLAATVASVETLVVAGNLGLLVVAWISTSLALHGLLVFHPDRPRAVAAARKKFVLARVGDALLVTAAVLLHSHAGTGDLRAVLDAARADSAGWGGSVQLAGVLLVGAALLKSAQFPTHGWLVEVMETPTPVSALLHAGVLNAGPFLVMRTAQVVDHAHFATLLLIVVGGTTALFASVVRTTQPAVKVALSWSSAAHMGFTLFLCGLGAYPAALLHLVAHSFYKAHAFLSASSAVDEGRASHVALTPRLGRVGRVAGAAVVATALYAIAALVAGTDATLAVLVPGAVLVLGVTQLTGVAFDAHTPRAAIGRALALAVVVVVAFVGLELGTHGLLDRTVPSPVDRTALHAVAAGVVLAGFALAVLAQLRRPARAGSPRRNALAVHLRNGFYANALFDRATGALRRTAPRPSSLS